MLQTKHDRKIQQNYFNLLPTENMTQEAPDEWERYDVLQHKDGEQEVCPAGDGEPVIRAHERLARKRRLIATLTIGISVPVLAMISGWYSSRIS